MKESWVSLPTIYVPMVGVPILLFAYTVSIVAGFQSIGRILLALSMVGLFVFGVSGFRDVYINHWNGKRTRLRPAVTINKGSAADVTLPRAEAKIVNFHVNRFNPETQRLEESVYGVETDSFSNVLDGLLKIKTESDPTLSMRYSCRMGICGSCGMVINGKPSLACETNVWKNLREDKITVAPMLGHPLLRDLVTDFDDFFERHLFVNPYLFRNDLVEKYHPTVQYNQTKEELDKFLPFSDCIMCGLCLDACPVVNTNQEFIGPQALSQAYRYYADSRDEAGKTRLDHVDLLKGVWDCEFAASCSDVCPKGVDPAFAIQLLKTEIIKNDFIKRKESKS